MWCNSNNSAFIREAYTRINSRQRITRAPWNPQKQTPKSLMNARAYISNLGNKWMSKKTSSKRRQKRAAGLEKHKEQERQKKKKKKEKRSAGFAKFSKKKK